MNVFNTLTQHLEEFTPLDGNRVRMYTCGPTVYNFAHIGNFRAYLFEDILRRALKHFGFQVVQVMNLTDVDDKTIRGARVAGLSLNAFTRPYKDAFFQDLRTLNVEAAEHYPAATEHIPEMISIIGKLLDKGHAYRSDDGSIYFRVSSFPAYGRLAHLDLSGLRPGARVAHDEYDKENLADFALWKAWDEEDGDVAWDSPWGRGRPGWHIECSAMSTKYLGETFDLHTGGVDNIFPHHEDEIAQTESATGKPFVKYWMHCAHLVVDGRKMSKSLGNFHTLRNVLERGYTGRETRYVLMAGHYRQSLNFTFDALDAARKSLERLDEFQERLADLAGGVTAGERPGWAAEASRRFDAALEEDLNVPESLAALFDLVHAGNKRMNEQAVPGPQAAAVLGLLDRFDRVLGVLAKPQEEAPAAAAALLEKRQRARQAKNWAESDRLRNQLAELGWLIQDTPQGAKLKRK